MPNASIDTNQGNCYCPPCVPKFPLPRRRRPKIINSLLDGTSDMLPAPVPTPPSGSCSCKSYTERCAPITNANIHDTVALWRKGSARDYVCTTYGNISDWNVSKVTDMSGLFDRARDFNRDISSWNVSKVTDMNNMFRDAQLFNRDISSWNVSGVTNMVYMFYGASDFNGDISSWNVSDVTDMNSMFNEAADFNQDIGGWNVSGVTNMSAMSAMFQGASAFNQNLSTWCVTNFLPPGPPDFAYGSALDTRNTEPVWGTCPST